MGRGRRKMAVSGAKTKRHQARRSGALRLTKLQAKGYEFLLGKDKTDAKEFPLTAACAMLVKQFKPKDGLHIYGILKRRGFIEVSGAEHGSSVVTVRRLTYKTVPDHTQWRPIMKRSGRKGKKEAKQPAAATQRSASTAASTANGSVGSHVAALQTLYAEVAVHEGALRKEGLVPFIEKDGSVVLRTKS